MSKDFRSVESSLDKKLKLRHTPITKKIDNFVWGIWAIFIILVCFLIPLFDIGSEMIKCGSLWFKC